jgi:hypothetical protein
MHKKGQQVLYCYQTGGECLSEEEGWRDFYLYGVHDVVILPERIGTIRSEYELLKNDLETIYCEVS